MVTAQTPEPQTVEELLAREEALSIAAITQTLERTAEDCLAQLDARRRIRANPIAAASIAALAGFLAGPMILGSVRGLSIIAPGLRDRNKAHPPGAWRGLAASAMRALRTRI